MMDKIAAAQRTIERIMLGIILRDRTPRNWRKRYHQRCTAKHRWTGHIARLSDKRWTIRALEWTPRNCTRKQGRPKTRWRDNLTRQIGPLWSRLAKNRHLRDRCREGYLCQEWWILTLMLLMCRQIQTNACFTGTFHSVTVSSVVK